jgi:hypothetical protein
MAQALDPHRFELRGDMFPVNHNVTAFSVSSVGAVATRSDPSPPLQHLVWRDRRGREMGVVGDPGRFGLMSLSLNAARLAHLILDPATGETDIWVRELPQGASWRLPSKGREFEPVWSPDGTQLIFGLGGLRPRSFLYRLASMAGEPERIGPDGRPSDWSRDGAYLLLVVGSPSNTVDLQVLKLGEQMPVPFVDSPSNERDGRFSPDASGPPRWIAYSEQVGNQSEVFVQSFSPGKHAAGAKWKISLSGGVQPRWRGDGKEIFYRDGQKLMAVPVDMSGTGFRPGTPVTLFEASPALDYAVASDGSRFLLSEEVPNQPPLKAPPVTVILNWQSLRH